MHNRSPWIWRWNLKKLISAYLMEKVHGLGAEEIIFNNCWNYFAEEIVKIGRLGWKFIPRRFIQQSTTQSTIYSLNQQWLIHPSETRSFSCNNGHNRVENKYNEAIFLIMTVRGHLRDHYVMPFHLKKQRYQPTIIDASLKIQTPTCPLNYNAFPCRSL